MFSGSWRESDQGKIRMEVADPNISVEAFHTALGSLYQV